MMGLRHCRIVLAGLVLALILALPVARALAQDVFSAGDDDYGDVFSSNGGGSDVFSSGDGGGTDIFNTNPGGSPAGPDEFSSGGQGYAPPRRLPCGMNALEGQAWAGMGGNQMLGALDALTRPACDEAFHERRGGQVCHLPQSSSEEGAPGVLLAAFRPGRDEDGTAPVIEAQAQASSGLAPGLWVGGKQILDARQAPALAAFLNGSGTRGPYQPGHLRLRVRIFLAMACHPHRRFEFKTAKDLATNILIRANAVIALETTSASCGFPALNQMPAMSGSWQSYVDPTQRASLIEKSLTTNTVDHIGFRSVQGVSATQAIDSFVSRSSILDCQLGLEFSIMKAIRNALDTDFDALHPPAPNALWGLGIPLTNTTVTAVTPMKSIFAQQAGAPTFSATVNANRDTSFGFHMVPVMFLPLNPCNPYGPWISQVSGNLRLAQRTILAEDMVPGDYAYLSNPADYEVWHPGGDTNGENAIYIGSANVGGQGPQRLFVVHGLGRIAEQNLRQAAVRAYNAPPTGGVDATGRPTSQSCPGDKAITLSYRPIETKAVHWTLLAGPTRAGDMREAGPYVR
jgi:hypothetical protein